jgi:hypothetical protein
MINSLELLLCMRLSVERSCASEKGFPHVGFPHLGTGSWEYRYIDTYIVVVIVDEDGSFFSYSIMLENLSLSLGGRVYSLARKDVSD